MPVAIEPRSIAATPIAESMSSVRTGADDRAVPTDFSRSGSISSRAGYASGRAGKLPMEAAQRGIEFGWGSAEEEAALLGIKHPEDLEALKEIEKLVADSGGPRKSAHVMGLARGDVERGPRAGYASGRAGNLPMEAAQRGIEFGWGSAEEEAALLGIKHPEDLEALKEIEKLVADSGGPRKSAHVMGLARGDVERGPESAQKVAKRLDITHHLDIAELEEIEKNRSGAAS